MGKLILIAAMTVDGAFEAPVAAPTGWFVLDPDSTKSSLEMWQAADAMVIGRKTYEGLAAVWPKLAAVPTLEAYAHRMNSMPKYVASLTLKNPLTWNATLLEGDLATAVQSLKSRHDGNLIVTGVGELARGLITRNLIDEFWVSVNPSIWPVGPRIFSDFHMVPLELIATTTFASGVVQLRYRLVRPDTTD